jgi:serine/threonine-protein phosphatase PGAM5
MTPMRKVYLIRHGEYDWQNREVTSLTDLGVQQAELTAQRIATLPVSRIYSSDLPRAVQTAEIIRRALGEIPYVKDPELRECYIEGLSSRNVPFDLLKAGERQASAAFTKYFRPVYDGDEVEIVVSHGNLIRYLIARILGRPDENSIRMRTLNCGISEVHVDKDGKIWVMSYNDVGHLPLNLVTQGLPQ